jgi:hypothetical protein
MEFTKDAKVKSHFNAEYKGVKYFICKSSFGWHSKSDINGHFEYVGVVVVNSRALAEQQCNDHADSLA